MLLRNRTLAAFTTFLLIAATSIAAIQAAPQGQKEQGLPEKAQKRALEGKTLTHSLWTVYDFLTTLLLQFVRIWPFVGS